MSWEYKIDRRALRELKKLGPQASREIIAYLENRVAGQDDPRLFGKALKGNLSGLWRYRVGAYRIVCQIVDQQLIVIVVAVGHRSRIYE